MDFIKLNSQSILSESNKFSFFYLFNFCSKRKHKRWLSILLLFYQKENTKFDFLLCIKNLFHTPGCVVQNPFDPGDAHFSAVVWASQKVLHSIFATLFVPCDELFEGDFVVGDSADHEIGQESSEGFQGFLDLVSGHQVVMESPLVSVKHPVVLVLEVQIEKVHHVSKKVQVRCFHVECRSVLGIEVVSIQIPQF